jgi:hypothetical protein
MLHAYSLEIALPNPDHPKLTFHAPIPKEFKKMVK